jgi:Fe2+ or Zn2+ uptake regulation protein
MRTPAQLTERFRASGRNVTGQRQCIFEVLWDNVDHPSAEAVYEVARLALPTLSLKTVYQTLHELVELGEISAIDVGTGAMRFDPNVETPHHHLVCRPCGKVRDLVVAFEGLDLPLGEDQGFDVDSTEVVFRGLCAACRAPVRRPRRRGPAH